MFRAALIAMLLFPVVPGVFAQTEQQDYTSQLLKLITLTDNKQYREAIDGYRLLQAERGTPEWLKASGEYEIAELHAGLQETERAIADARRYAPGRAYARPDVTGDYSA